MTMAVEGKLIEMNAHMVVTADATWAIVAGALLAVAFLSLLMVFLMGDVKRRGAGMAVCGAMVVLGIMLVIAGANTPREKEIRYCADGPVSLEQIVAVYKIVDIDGKEITVREK